MQLTRIFLVMLFFVFGVGSLAQAQNDFEIYDNTGFIIVLGDSLADGYKATNPDVKPLGCLKTLPNTGIQSLAVPGLTSIEILNRVGQAEAARPKLIFVSSGGNDTMQNIAKPGSYPATKSLQEMNLMFDRLQATGALVVYLGLNPPIKGAGRLQEITQLALNKGVLVVDGLKGLWGNPKYMSDPVHPNNAGYKIVCDRILATIEGYYP